MGLAKGRLLENALVVQGRTSEDGLKINEFVYHKILDCLGDIMLSGNRIFGHIKTSQGGRTYKQIIGEVFLISLIGLENFDSTENKMEVREIVAIGA